MVKSPCTNRCGLVGNICKGCGRTMDEIRRWRWMSEGEKVEVIGLLEDRLKKIKST